MKSNINVLCNGAKSNGKYGLMDYNGNIIIEPRFDKVTTATYDKIKYVIDTNSGYKLFKLPHYDDDITSFYKALFVYKSDSKYGLMDYKGHIVVEPKFDKITIDEPLLAAYIKKIESVDK